ncbi:MAG: DUF1343 domain-containing protein [Bacteroidales bacterium]|nr:DUF1343 domain-containing protein [Bacteroidales bacterium]MCF8343734.1 DUF1343 domain-containing protein [Bacteroidales bacterium]MCF8349652.1 DUF1343 domain-containing protein [Bacteroidales bacterium]MCF8374898.1 DUF1343 domain-containing protein [Bacteroidales bacterium]MCF8400123.1 DUF1343 domain-containing protein [Bacteroidales bacterium]
MFKKPFFLLIGLIFQFSCSAQIDPHQSHEENLVLSGAYQFDSYLPMLKDKRVALVANHTSKLNRTHLADSLLALDVNLVKVFSPEHGFRGKASAGEQISAEKDAKTGLPIVSLYGSHKKPTTEDLQDVDIVLFDLQDVGVRVYTYISTMSYVMEACAENYIPVVVLDRPNPNGHYVDGPVLEKDFSSFVGLHPVPLVHGMTVGEYARMLNGEGWLENGIKCELRVIPVKNYDHNTLYQLPVQPSPNLRDMNAIYLYPSLVLFEGTIVSVGRGTEHPFEVLGHPDFMIGSYTFKPEPNDGAKHPKHEGQQCYGTSLIGYTQQAGIPDELKLGWLIAYYDYFKEKEDFFIPFFDKLAGNDKLRKQIISGMSEEEIRDSWEVGLECFEKVREKYSLYGGF